MAEKLNSQNVAKSVGKKVKELKPLIKKLTTASVERADQVLLGLSHTKEAVPTMLKQTLQRIDKNPADLVGRVSRSVLERAEDVRKQLMEKAEDSEALLNKRWVPEWLKEASFVRSTGEAAPLANETASSSSANVAADAAPAMETASSADMDSADVASAAKPAKAKKSSPKSAKTKKPARSKKA